MSQFEIPALTATSGPAFDWLCQELELPSEEDRQALRKAFIELRYQSSRRVAKKLLAVWPEGASWPSGQEWLQSGESHFENSLENLLFLLHIRFAHVANRLYRDAQTRAAIHPDSPDRWCSDMQVIVNSINLDGEQTNACGLSYGQIMSIEAGLYFMRQPAHAHPECRCTIGPFKAKRVRNLS